jgi:hypothetical protein
VTEAGDPGGPVAPRPPTTPVTRASVRGKGRNRTRSQEKARPEPKPPPFAFWKGAAVGTVVVVPLVAATVWVLAKLGVGDRSVPWIVDLRFTAIFAGAAAVLSAAGIGRLAAQASVEGEGGLKRAMWIGARTQAVAGAGLTIVAAIPHGHLPHSHWAWIVYAIAGAATGAGGGAVIGLFCGGPAPIGFSDVVAVARWPAEALRAATRGELPKAPRIARRKRPS